MLEKDLQILYREKSLIKWIKNFITYATVLLLICGHSSIVAAVDAVNKAEQSIALALTDEPPDLSSLTTTDSISIMLLAHVMEGLLTYDAQNELVGGVAERWELTEHKATFWLRRAVLWSDGLPVTAHDFVFAWQTAVTPATGSAYASILFPVKNAEAINSGKLPASELGVHALDDYTLEVFFEKPTPYFLSLTAFATYYPVREDFYRQQGKLYAAEASNMLYNGRYIIEKWVHGAELTLRKNPKYWQQESVKLDKIAIPYITSDPTARYNLFKDGNIALAGLDAETLKDALRQPVKMRRFLDGGLMFLEFNHRVGRVTTNKNFRKAIQSVIDTDVLVNKVIGIPGNIPGESVFPLWLQGVSDKLRSEYPPAVVVKDYERARNYLALAKQELGLKAIPSLIFLTGDAPAAAKEAEYFQRVLKQHLDIDVRIDRQIFKQRLAKMTSGEFDIVSTGWGPDFNDPITFGNLFASWNENNRGRYSSAEYDHWVAVSESTIDQTVRMKAMAAMQQILIDDAALIPLYERGAIYLQHSQLKGVVRRIFGGDPYFGYAHVD